MAFWGQVFRSKDKRAAAPSDANILVISDIHLGEDVLTTGPEHLSEYIRVLNQELAAFVAAHTETRADARPWHLIINGDMFDFVKVSLEPSPEEAYEHWSRNLSDEERARLPNTPENVVWKLGRILEIHRPLFKELAHFIMAGNRVTLIEGNHDAEFFFPEVQSALREFIVAEVEKASPPKKRRGDPDPEAIGERLQFRTWFDAEPGRYHIEHGNQFDAFCSFEYNLAPLERREAEILATPMTHRIMPLFAEMLGDFSTHGIEKWTFGDWMKFVFNLGPRMIWIMARIYFGAMWELLGQAGKKRRALQQALEDEHRRKLDALAHTTPYGVSTLEQLDALKATPAEYSAWKMWQVFYIDQFAAIAIGTPLIILGAVLGGAWWWMSGIAVVAMVGAMRVFARWRRHDVPDALRRGAAAIAEHTGARYVVFGHSHHPELVNLTERYGVGRYGERCYYLNSGSWVTREILQGQEGKGMTYVQISSRGAFLKRWLGRGHSPVVLAATDDRASEDVVSSARPRLEAVERAAGE